MLVLMTTDMVSSLILERDVRVAAGSGGGRCRIAPAGAEPAASRGIVAGSKKISAVLKIFSKKQAISGKTGLISAFVPKPFTGNSLPNTTSLMGIQIAGLASGLNWQNIINELIAADSVGVNQVAAQRTQAITQVSALGTLNSDLASLENSIFSLEDPRHIRPNRRRFDQ